jgi:hypothetical protein
MSGQFEDLIRHLARSSGLTEPAAAHLVEEVLGFFDELPEEFVQRRHREMQMQGRQNAEILARLAAEMGHRRFRAPAYSERQIRRMIYG